MGNIWVTRIWKLSIFLVTAFFLGQTALAHAQDIQSLQFQDAFFGLLTAAVILILVSEWIAGVLWWRVLDYLGQTVPLSWAVTTFFKTTLAKYLPGNVWHLVGRVNASRQFNLPVERIGLSVVIEPLFMVTGGLILSLMTWKAIVFQVMALCLGLLVLHPWGIGKLAWGLDWIKQRAKKETAPQNTQELEPLHRYPWPEILLGVLFMLLRGAGFGLTILSLEQISWFHAPELISGFSLAWLMGIVLPAPGGMGVFESSAIQLLSDVSRPAVLLSSVVLFRFLCISTEVLGVGLVVGAPKMLQLLRSFHHSRKAMSMPSASPASSVES